MRKRTIYFSILVFTLLAVGSLLGQSTESGAVTPVIGESWLEHLHRTFDETSMGKTGRLGPPELVPAQQTTSPAPAVDHSKTVVLSGSDLYRLNCRGCHGEFGAGAPPEINSVISPVRASSAALVMARMKNAGAQMTRADAIKLADQSKALLLQRLHNGGQDMPPFPQLNDAETKVLMGYLRQLADVPGAERERGSMKVSPLRVGELIVKSTCHTCHGATGANPTPQELSDGAIPPLSTLTSRVNRTEFVRKVTQGAPVVMGTPALLYRGRMPVFYYLSSEEAAYIYQYLATYPPTKAGDTDVAVTSEKGGAGDPPSVAPAIPTSEAATSESNHSTVADPIILTVAGLVMLLLAGGTAFTIWELRKLAPPAFARQPTEDYSHTPVAPMKHDMVA